MIATPYVLHAREGCEIKMTYEGEVRLYMVKAVGDARKYSVEII